MKESLDKKDRQIQPMKPMDLSHALDHKYRLARDGQHIPALNVLLEQIIPTNRYAEKLAQGTLSIAHEWIPPETIGSIIPDPRVIAMDSITSAEVLELRKLWGTHVLRKEIKGTDPFRFVLISCRALMMLEKHPATYLSRKKPSVPEH